MPVVTPQDHFRTLVIGAIDRQWVDELSLDTMTGPQILAALNAHVPILVRGEEQKDKWGYPEFAAHLSDLGIQLALFDFDMTLAWTGSFYTRLEHQALQSVFRELQAEWTPEQYSYDEAKKIHSIHIHGSMTALLPAHAIAAKLVGPNPDEWTEKDHLRFNHYRDEFKLKLVQFIHYQKHRAWSDHILSESAAESLYEELNINELAARPDEGVMVERVAGSTKLLISMLACGFELKIATNSPRNTVEVLSNGMGFNTIISPDDMTCVDDESLRIKGRKLSKVDPEYWTLQTQGYTDPRAVVGFEDNPTAAKWMLQSGHVHWVICRDEPQLHQDFSPIIAEFPNRIFVVSDWSELLEQETIQRLKSTLR